MHLNIFQKQHFQISQFYIKNKYKKIKNLKLWLVFLANQPFLYFFVAP